MTIVYWPRKATALLAAAAALFAAACAREVPVALETRLADLPRECRASVPSRLPKVPAIEAATVTPADLNRHWVRAYSNAGVAHARAVGTLRVCQRWARAQHRAKTESRRARR